MKSELCPKALVLFIKVRLRIMCQSSVFNGSENEKHESFKNLHVLQRSGMLTTREG